MKECFLQLLLQGTIILFIFFFLVLDQVSIIIHPFEQPRALVQGSVGGE